MRLVARGIAARGFVVAVERSNAGRKRARGGITGVIIRICRKRENAILSLIPARDRIERVENGLIYFRSSER